MLMIDEDKTRNRRYAEYRREWAKQNLKKVCLSFRIDEYEELKARAEAKGETVNHFMKKAVKDRMTCEVIRCKECKWYGEPGCAIRIVDDTDKPSEMDFCSFAERKEGE